MNSLCIDSRSYLEVSFLALLFIGSVWWKANSQSGYYFARVYLGYYQISIPHGLAPRTSTFLSWTNLAGIILYSKLGKASSNLQVKSWSLPLLMKATKPPSSRGKRICQNLKAGMLRLCYLSQGLTSQEIFQLQASSFVWTICPLTMVTVFEFV